MLTVSRNLNFPWEQQCKQACQNYFLATSMLKEMVEAKAEGLSNDKPDPIGLGGPQLVCRSTTSC